MNDESMKERFSASVDADLLVAARRAVADGLAPSLSAWVNTAMRHQVETDARLRAMDEWIAAYEAEHGVISDDEIAAAERWVAERTIRWWDDDRRAASSGAQPGRQ
jgi:hypothetical protein